MAAAPGGGGWFHQHFGVGEEPLRILNYWGGPYGKWGTADRGEAGEKVKAGNLFGIKDGGRTILYHEEDPYVRSYFRERLAEVGVDFTMPDQLFAPPAAP